jgi:DNA-binding SARP family transcriptional activator
VVDRATYVREAHVAFRCLPHNAGAKRRADVLMHLASAERTGGRPGDARRLLDEGLATFAAEPGEARAALLTMAATLDGVEGRFPSARARMSEAASLARSDFFDDLALHYIDVHEAFFRGRVEDGFIVLDEVLRRSLARGRPLFAAYAAMNAAIFAWASADDRRTADAVATLADLLTPGLQRGFAPIVDAFHGRPASGIEDAWPVHAAIAELFACGTARTPAEALAAARRALGAADAGGDPYLRMVAAAAGISLGDRTLHASLRDAVAAVESPEAHDAVRRLIAGDDNPGLLAPIVRRFARSAAAPPRLRVEFLSGNVVRDGTPIELREKERELVLFLATQRAGATVETIGDAVWPYVTDEAWTNNLKVTLSRLRAKCAGIPIVEAHAGRYRLAPTVDVDLRALESLLRTLPAGVRPAAAVHRTLTAACNPFLHGTAPNFERYAWIEPSLVRIRDIVCACAAVLARTALAEEDAETTLAYADVMLALDEYREDALEFAVRADRLRGDPAGANARIRRFTAALREAGLEPTSRIEQIAAVPIA